MVIGSLIIPVYNHAVLTRQCLDRLLSIPPESCSQEIIVVDDCSTDSTPRLLKGFGDRIRSLRHDRNQGFATSCNDGARAATGDWLVFLNNDTLPLAGWVDALVSYADAHPNAAAVGGKLLYPNDTIQHAGVVVRQDRWLQHLYAGFPGDHPAVNKSRRFQIVTAGCVLIRRGPFERMGGFDPAFLNGYEDVDLCLRLGDAGHEIHYCHESVVYHLEKISREDQVRDLRSQQNAHNERLYRERWADRVRPDELDYYLEDGLLAITHSKLYPLQFSIAPELGTVEGDERERRMDRILGERSRQVLGLLRENIRLSIR